MKKYYRLPALFAAILAVILLTMSASNIAAEVPQLINFQGWLTTSSGSPVSDGTYSIKFKIYGSDIGVDSLWYTPFQPVVVTNGIFNHQLGSAVPLPHDLFSVDTTRYLGITVWGDTEISPRTRLVSTAYTYHALRADTAGYALSAGTPTDNDWTIDGDDVYRTTGNVGIGTSTPSELLTVGDDLTYFSGNMITVGDADPTSYAGISFGQDTDNRGWMVYDNVGDYVYWGTKENGDFSPHSMYFKDGGLGLGVLPWIRRMLTIEKTYDPFFPSDACYGIHCRILASDDNGYLYGSKFTVQGGSQNVGLQVTAHASDFCIGGQFNSDDIGVLSTAPMAGSFNGSVSITGNLSKSSGSFKIDHPLDPENKFLLHSFVESPDMMNVYNGNVILDEDGRAIVKLPHYFDALNKDFRYQLTAIGAPGPNLYIAEEITENQFVIAGGAPGSKVSWQVTGIRQDPWANEHRIQDEVGKNDDEKGFYLAPELYGFGKDKGLSSRYFEVLKNTDISE